MAAATKKRSMLLRLAEKSHDHRRIVVGAWLLTLLVTIALAQSYGGDFNIDFQTPSSESTHAVDQLKAHFPQAAGDTIDIVFTSPDGVDAPAVQQAITGLVAKASADAGTHVVGTITPYDAAGAHQVSTDRSVGFAVLQLDVPSDHMPHAVTAALIADAKAASTSNLQVELNGFAVRQAEQSGPSGEALGLLAAVIILLISFGSVLAMGLPILIAVFGLGVGTALMALIANLVQTPSFATTVAAMIGIGVGIDYVLFIVTRYRSELHRGRAPRDAVVTAIGTAGRAVLFAGCTVIISLMGLFVIGLTFLQGVAISAAAGVLVVMLCSITLLPALLGFIGVTIDRFKVPFVKTGLDDNKGFWFRWSRTIQRRPWPAALLGLAFLLLLAAPVLSIRFGFPDAGQDPPTTTARKAYDLETKGFGPGYNGPFILVAELTPGTDQSAALTRVSSAVAATPGIAAVAPPLTSPDGAIALLRVIPTTSPQAAATETTLHELRDTVLPAATAGSGMTVRVGGNTAAAADINEYMAGRLPIFIGTVVFLSFILLLVVFRSVLVALKAAVMNILSILAAYGVVGWAMQGGWFGGLIGIHEPQPLPSFIPMIMFAILFGLSMDYEVFLLSRIREEWLRTGNNGLAVADGLAQTARVITAAGAIMVCVFSGFVLGDDVTVKAIGIGMAAAIFVDATVVRMVLVPSTMELLGDANCWLPKWLDRVLPEFHIEGTHEDDDLEAELDALVARESSTPID
jgi:putative drug exporter of the RND superfamily